MAFAGTEGILKQISPEANLPQQRLRSISAVQSLIGIFSQKDLSARSRVPTGGAGRYVSASDWRIIKPIVSTLHPLVTACLVTAQSH